MINLSKEAISLLIECITHRNAELLEMINDGEFDSIDTKRKVLDKRVKLIELKRSLTYNLETYDHGN